MVRAWGGGSYLPDWAYDMADEMGIMIWTEFRKYIQELSVVNPVQEL
jgi:beta-galactosidase/beta-glucuronidase